MRKTFREYKKVKEDVDDSRVDQKQKEFYENLFKGEPENATVAPNNRRAPTPKGGNKETTETPNAEGD